VGVSIVAILGSGVQGQRQKINTVNKRIVFLTSAVFKLRPVAGNTVSNWDSCKVRNFFWGGRHDYSPPGAKKCSTAAVS